MTHIKLLTSRLIGDHNHAPGAVILVPREFARLLIQAGAGLPVEPPPAPVPPKSMPSPTLETATNPRPSRARKAVTR